MKKVGIITIIDNNNYGNRLQNYAVQQIINNKGFKSVTLKNQPLTNSKDKIILRKLRSLFNKNNYSEVKERANNFKEFNKKINTSKRNVAINDNLNEFDYFVVGSDQVWNSSIGRLREMDLLDFTTKNKKISFSASFGINNIGNVSKTKISNSLKDFKAISVRENIGKDIVESLTHRNDVQVLLDPTMILDKEEWNKVIQRPNKLDLLSKNNYILNYFLGELSNERKKEIYKIAKEYDCEIINILDKNSPFYDCGPSEFLYLEKNAKLVCTDSFHSCVFAILFNTPFLVFDREQENVASMNSRIDTLLSKFNLENRRFKDSITLENLQCDYSNAYEILKIEREKANNFLKRALDIED